MSSRLRVHVLVDLAWRAGAGGHVKVWERLAAAAVGLKDVDLTVHFSGPRPGTHELGDNVRYRVHAPVFSTARLPFLSDAPDHTDLALHHRELARALRGGQVLHTTDAFFAFARTAERIARRDLVPLVNSVHTDTPRYAGLYTTAALERLLGRAKAGSAFGRLLGGLSRCAQARMERRLLAHQRLCAYALVSRPSERERLAEALSPERVGVLRRGIDRLFTLAQRDPSWLRDTFAVPPGRLVILAVGRIDRGKNVAVLVEAVVALRAEGVPVHLLCAGEGPERNTVAERLPGAATCPGVLAPETLARVYASADLLAHPSEIEESSNVIREALASGLPVVASESAGCSLVDGETGVVVRGGAWTESLRSLARDRALREALGRQGRAWAERELPSWSDVLTQDLLPWWRKAAAP